VLEVVRQSSSEDNQREKHEGEEVIIDKKDTGVNEEEKVSIVPEGDASP
jgi:hypothetical protein